MRPADIPAVDDRAVEPETGTEMIHGEVRKVLPADPPHADRQCDIAYVLRSNVAPGYVASTELLTRVDHDADFATDACIRRVGRDPDTGSRYLEELSFEVVHTQSDADITDRARQLIRRGVRRVFAIHVREEAHGGVKAGPVREWLASEDRWLDMAPSADIVDPCLMEPVRVQALLDATEANNQVARALLAQDNPVLAADKQEALQAQARELTEAHARALQERDAQHAREMQAKEAQYAREMQAKEAQHAREMQARDAQRARATILALCDVLAIELTTERRARLDAMTREQLDALCSAIRAQRRWPGEL